MITAAARRNDGDVTAAITEAVGWIADNLPVYAVNILLSTSTDLWALRYPESHELYVLDRPRDGALDMHTRRIGAHSDHLADTPSVVVASEPMDDDPRWRLLHPGELLHIDADLNISGRIAFPDAPRHLLRREDLSPSAQVAQHPQG